jgi:hypothetical protein
VTIMLRQCIELTMKSANGLQGVYIEDHPWRSLFSSCSQGSVGRTGSAAPGLGNPEPGASQDPSALP